MEYCILIDGKEYFRKFYPYEKLKIIRDELGYLMSSNARFYYKNSEIDVNDEIKTSIEEIIENNKCEIITKNLFLEKKIDNISLSPKINDKSTDSFKEVVLEKSEQILQNKKNEHFNDDLRNIPIKKDNPNNSKNQNNSNSSSSECSDSD